MLTFVSLISGLVSTSVNLLLRSFVFASAIVLKSILRGNFSELLKILTWTSLSPISSMIGVSTAAIAIFFTFWVWNKSGQSGFILLFMRIFEWKSFNTKLGTIYRENTKIQKSSKFSSNHIAPIFWFKNAESVAMEGLKICWTKPGISGPIFFVENRSSRKNFRRKIFFDQADFIFGFLTKNIGVGVSRFWHIKFQAQ